MVITTLVLVITIERFQFSRGFHRFHRFRTSGGELRNQFYFRFGSATAVTLTATAVILTPFSGTPSPTRTPFRARGLARKLPPNVPVNCEVWASSS